MIPTGTPPGSPNRRQVHQSTTKCPLNWRFRWLADTVPVMTRRHLPVCAPAWRILGDLPISEFRVSDA
jgi:hypothetical protein